MQEGAYHVPVMLNEVLEGLQIKPSGTYVDCTFGGGGHGRAILDKLNNQGRLIAFDQDADALTNVAEDKRLIFIPHNFRHLQRFLRLHKISRVNGILADLGVSSHQFDIPERGFSTRFESTLDMRMDQKQELTALFIIKTYSEERLHKIFEQYGEVTNAKTLAKTLTEQRKVTRITTVNELRNVLQGIVKGNPNKYFAQVFQALRIEVNDEFGALSEMLSQVPQLLEHGGRIAIISFHSLEDRIVKNFFKGNDQGDEVYGEKPESLFKIITKKPILATGEEIKRNTRARSARLRIAELK